MHRFLCCVLLLLVFVSFAAISEEMPVRLHVVAESDDAEAQEIKLRVKDAVLQKAIEVTKDSKTASEAYSALITSIGEIRLCAREAALQLGYKGPVYATVTHEVFPARLYGDVILKEGEYPTLLIEIGNAEGRNWWCVIYPDLCLYGEKTDEGGIQFYSKFGFWFKQWMGRWKR